VCRLALNARISETVHEPPRVAKSGIGHLSVGEISQVERLISLAGNLVAVIGLMMCLVGGVVRLLGNFHLFGYSAMTIFIAGTGLMVMACLAKVELLLLRERE